MKKKSRGIGFILSGAVLIILALSLVLYNNIQNKNYKKSADEILVHLNDMIDYQKVIEGDLSGKGEEDIYSNIQFSGGSSSEGLQYKETTVEYDGVEYIGVINIPSLDITLPVTSGCDNDKMKLGACRYMGSKENDDLIICAHNLEAFFSRIKNMNNGDIIIFVDATGHGFSYEVIMIDVMGGYETDRMTENSNEWDITLFTCTYGGQNRYAVRAVLIDK